MPDSVTPRESISRALITAARERLRRLQLGRVPAAQLVWVIGCWAVAGLILLGLFWPGAVTAITEQGGMPGLESFSAPLWFRLLGSLGAAVVVGAFFAAEPGRSGLFRVAPLVGVVVAPALVMAADAAWVFAIPSLVLGIAGVALRYTRASAWLSPLLASTSWAVLVAYQFTPSGADPGSWVWVVGVGFAAAVAAFGTYYGVARAAQTRTRAVGALTRSTWHPVVVLSIALAAVGIVAARLTLLRDLFPAPDPALWSPQTASILSWPPAVLVAAVLAAVAVWSTRRPLLRGREGSVIAGLAVLGNLHLVVAAAVILVGLVAALFGATAMLTSWTSTVPALKVVGVVALGLIVLLPHFRGTAVRWLMIVGALFLLPNTLTGLLRDTGAPAFAPSPVQVTVLLVVIALGLAIANVARPWTMPIVRPGLVVRLAVVPLIAVHAGWLLPAAWTPIGLVGVVVAIVVAVLLRQPPPAADNARHGSQVVRAAAAQAGGFALALLAAPALLDDGSLVGLGLVWLSVVVTAALCFDTTDSAPASQR